MKKDRMAVITHPKSHHHVQPFPRPNLESFEAPLRTQMAEHYLRETGLLNEVDQQKAPRANIEDILKVHTPYLVESVRLMSNIGSGVIGESAHASPDLYRTAMISVGGAILAAELVARNEVKHAFSLMRPPGHHASRSTAAGLCYFNNIAIATMKLMDSSDIKRVTIFDFDDHFGNGTADIFYANKNVQYISIHEYDYENFGIGHYEELGFGEAVGTNINIPLIDATSDMVYREAVKRIAIPSILKFEPDIIGLSAGFDSHYADPVGNMNIDTSTFWYIGKTINETVEKLGIRGSFSVLEGGYNPLIIGPSIHALLYGLDGREMPKLQDQIQRETVKSLDDANLGVLDKVEEIVGRFW
ncbi:MAG: histone deacetylase family protein [Candidatus Thorarchaeota archaeon]